MFARRAPGELPPPPLRKHGQGQKNNGHTESPCLGKPVLARDAQHPWYLTALVLVRPPNLPLMVMGMGCELGRGRHQKVHDVEAQAHSSCTANE